ncbi:hypothetical protein OG500_14060 [Kitasatospora sp. NBC_01250]|uniref:hypothetical protein n=1 Tax=unclassified Kitasatospora TaxID=2633591 RepID=UPI002E10E246|nr:MULTISPECIES: hypothetical protein [unclassified Kitasatospora]WSJ67375.1 hypothetical protein OG294_15335 [Kitasatospora sp. NBC_01302]
MRVGITGYQGLSDLTELLVRGELWRLVTAYGPYELVGVTALRPGPETWFAGAVREHGGKVEIILPAGAGPLPDTRLAREATAVHRLAPVAAGGLGDDLGRALVGMVDELIAVWDGTPGGEPAEIAGLTRRAGLWVHEVWPTGSERPGQG